MNVSLEDMKREFERRPNAGAIRSINYTGHHNPIGAMKVLSDLLLSYSYHALSEALARAYMDVSGNEPSLRVVHELSLTVTEYKYPSERWTSAATKLAVFMAGCPAVDSFMAGRMSQRKEVLGRIEALVVIQEAMKGRKGLVSVCQ